MLRHLEIEGDQARFSKLMSDLRAEGAQDLDHQAAISEEKPGSTQLLYGIAFLSKALQSLRWQSQHCYSPTRSCSSNKSCLMAVPPCGEERPKSFDHMKHGR